MERYYVTSVEYNMNAQAENRSVPKAYDNIDDAKKEYYGRLSKNIGNDTLGWCNVIMWDIFGNLVMSDYWVRAEVEEVTD